MFELPKRILLRFRRVFSIAAQILIMIAANRAAVALRFDGAAPAWAIQAWWQMLPWLVAIRALTFVPFRLYEGLWRYTSIYDLKAILGAVLSSSAIFYLVVRSPLGPPVYPRSIFISDALLLILMLSGIRLARRIYAEFSTGMRGKRVLIFGAGDAGELIVRDMKANPAYGYQPLGFVDDDRSKVGKRIHGVPVLGTRAEVVQIMGRHKPDEALIAMPGAEPVTIRAVIRTLEPFKIPIKTLPKLRDILDGKVDVAQIRGLAIEDLLARAPVGLDAKPLKRLIEGRRVMVTGAGGSIGSELCRQIARLRPASLVMFERYENSLHEIRVELDDAGHTFVHPVVGDVTDIQRVKGALLYYQPEIVFHAAAHKHVPLMEENPCEAIKNNVRGTRRLAEAAEQCGVDRFILISTDKAVNPTSVMGASKRLAELVVQAQAVGSGTSFCTVRFGNVLGSNGSVVPRFLEQIRNGGPVTITHPDMRRFFMLIPEAVQLVLHAASQAQGGATYVLEMGEQVKLVDMARDMIRLSGFVPEDIPIEYIGLRPGEKLYEELVGNGEDVRPSPIDKIMCVTSRTRPDPDLLTGIRLIESEAADGRPEAVLASLRALLPEFGAPPVDAPSSEEVTAAFELSAALAGDPIMPPVIEHPCPSCNGVRVHRSRPRGMGERVRRQFSDRRLFRCDDCGWRGWLIPLQFSDLQSIDAPAEPDLSSLDLATTPIATGRRRFAPRDLN